MKYTFLWENTGDDSNFSFWQSNEWRHILITSGQASYVQYFWNIHWTVLLVEIRSIGIGMKWAFVIGITHSQIKDDIEACIVALKKELSCRGVIFLQIEPLDESVGLIASNTSDKYRSFLTPYTRVIDLEQDESDILANMHEKGRYNIRLASRRGVTVELVNITPENIDIWMQLLADTTTRDGFSHNSKMYYQTFASMPSARMYFAYWQDQVIAAGIWIFSHDRAIYYYGASSSQKEHRKQMAPYSIQWRAIQDAKKINIKLYDFLWVADPNDPNDSLIWVSTFKSRFWWELIQLPQKYLIPLSKKYLLFQGIRTIKKWIKNN